jgi:hypothetical protein
VQREFGVLDYVIRWLAGLILVLGTYNPYALSYYQWITEYVGMVPLKMMVGIALLILHLVAILAGIRSLGLIGIGLLTSLYASAAWVLIDNEFLNIEEPKVFTFTLLVILACVYGWGLSWSHIRNRVAGQVDSTDVAQNSPI